MSSKKNLPCFILARGGSKGLKKKNLYNFLNKPLIWHTINYAKKCRLISHVVVSTDSKEINQICKKLKCEVIFPRPKKLSNDNSKSLYGLIHAAKEFEKKFGNFEMFAFMQATEPFRPKNILSDCINTLLNNKKLNSVFAAYEYKKNFWIQDKKKFKLLSLKNNIGLPRQSKIKKIIYREDCGISLVSRKKVLLDMKKIYAQPLKIIPYNTMHGFLDIHSKKDVKFGESLKKFI